MTAAALFWLAIPLFLIASNLPKAIKEAAETIAKAIREKGGAL